MSADELPQDLERWPKDPYALLGVSHNVSLKDLKRAYAQRIRVFKPEHFPDHFRRLREAYEALQHFAQWRSIEPDLAEPLASEAVDSSASVLPAPKADEEASWSRQLAAAWELAVSGAREEAYAQLRALEERRPRHPDLCARLYWLLWISPELDWARDRNDWLAAGLSTAGLAGPLRELYSRELSADPVEAVRDRCTNLLDAPASAGLLAGFIEERWRAAASLGDASPLVAGDLERLHLRIASESEDVWLRLLATGIEHLLWSPDEQLRRRALDYRLRIDAAEHLHHRMEYLLDQLEISSEVANAWREWGSQGDLRHRLAELMRHWRLADSSKIRVEAEAALRPLLMAPSGLLSLLTDKLIKSSVAMMAFGQLIDRLDDANEAWQDERDEEALDQLVRAFARRLDFSNYENLRVEVVKFCAREGLLAEQFRQALGNHARLGYPASIPFKLEADLALHITLKAYRLFWT